VGAVPNRAVLYDSYAMGWAPVDGDMVDVHPLPLPNSAERMNARVSALVGWFPDAIWARLDWRGAEMIRISPPGPGERITLAHDGFGNVTLLPGPNRGSLALLAGSYQVEAALADLGATSRLSRAGATRGTTAPGRMPRGFVALASGEVFVIELPAEFHDRRQGAPLLVERFAPDAGVSTTLEVPSPFAPATGDIDAVICAGKDRVVHVVRDTWRTEHTDSAAYVMSWDGSSWKTSPELPESTTGYVVQGCCVPPDGSLWTAFAGVGRGFDTRVYRLGQDGTWSKVPLPEISPPEAEERITRGKSGGQWAFQSSPWPGRGRTRSTLEATAIYATDTGEVWIQGRHMLNDHPVMATGGDYFGYVRDVVLRSGPPRKAGVLEWASVAGNALEAQAAWANKQTYRGVVPAGPAPVPTTAPAPPPDAAPRPLPKRPVAAAPPVAPVPTASAPHGPAPEAPVEPLVGATAQCKSAFVVFYTASSMAPPDYDYPLTRDALKGHAEFADASFMEVDYQGKRVFGAAVPTLELGRRLQALIQSKVVGSKPQLMCGRPQIKRFVPMGIERKSAP
jgi:hypothetical protein